MPKDTPITIDPIINKNKTVRTKRVIINTPLNDSGGVDTTIELIQETAVVTTFQSGAIQVERKEETRYTPDISLVNAFIGASLPTGQKAVKFWEAFGDSLT